MRASTACRAARSLRSSRATRDLAVPVGQHTQIVGQRAGVKIFAFTEFGIIVSSAHSGPRKRAYRDRHERGPDGGGRGSHRRRWFRRAESRERRRRAHDRCDRRTAKSCRPGARGLCAKSCGDVCSPTGPRASAIRTATGAIVHRSPGRTRHKPFQPLRREGRDAPVALFPAVQCSAICPWHSGSIGASRLPVFPAPSFN
ncbi:hypothetical protein ACVWZZ_000637 [Bradyrhizobium sp. LM6.10]